MILLGDVLVMVVCWQYRDEVLDFSFLPRRQGEVGTGGYANEPLDFVLPWLVRYTGTKISADLLAHREQYSQASLSRSQTG